jgi:hypothetical protein
MQNFILKNAIWILIIICLISRLPILLNTNLLLDPDECVVGLMAKHAMEGKAVPMFFYGQSYGFSWVEVSLIRIFYFFLGVNDLAVRLPMLLLFIVGIVFHYKTLQNMQENDENKSENYNNLLPFLIALLFACAPTWAIWSMKARGGYLTAFALFGCSTYLISNHIKFKNTGFQILVGGLLVVLFQAQPLFLVGLMPILGFYLYKNKSIVAVLKISIGTILAAVFFMYNKQGLSDFWQPKIIAYEFFKLKNIDIRISETLSGSHVFWYENPVFVTVLWSKIIFFLSIISLVSLIYFIIKKENPKPLFYIFCLSVVATVGYKLFIKDESPRYLLPLYGCISFLLFGFFSHLSFYYKKYLSFYTKSIAIIALLGFVSVCTFSTKNFDTTNKTEVNKMINDLKIADKKYVFCGDGILVWQLLFYSKEQLIVRGGRNPDRYQNYVNAVNAAHETQPERTVILDRLRDTSSNWSPNLSNLNQSYFIYRQPDKKILALYHFQL